MDNENNFEQSPSNNMPEEKSPIKKENIILKGWNDFIKNVSDGINKLQEVVEKNIKGNEELWQENQGKFFKFFEDLGNSWEDQMNAWSKEVEESVKTDTEKWEENKGQFTEFINKTKNEWNSKIQQWTTDLEKKKIENNEQWEAKKQKIKEDMKNWQEKTQKDWNKGLKSFRREMIKGSYMFLVFMIPILVVLIIIVWLINWVMRPFS